MAITTYEEALAFIHGRTQFKKSPTLDRMRYLVEKLGNPQLQLKMIHVTGTNGKGSTTAYLRDLLMSQGFKVGTYTSPFITRFNERISVNGQMIADNDLVALVNEVYPVVKELDAEDLGPTEFEIITAIMFTYFSRVKVDYAVIEVGLGGLNDSTNIITPLVSVITTVALDHARWLGDTVTKIAFHKAGIIKKQTPIVVGRLPKEALDVVKQRAQKLQAPLYEPQSNYQVTNDNYYGWGEAFTYRFEDKTYRLQLQMLGSYQIDNAACALTAFLILAHKEGFVPTGRELKAALGRTTWPGRFEKLTSEPLIVIDGAHNEAASLELKKLLQTRFADMQVKILMAVLADKQADKMIANLASLPNVELTLTTFAGPREVTSLKHYQTQFPDLRTEENWQAAFLKIIKELNGDDMLLITGSLYFISDVRNYFIEEG
ncbi:bifunctional folylpolyglutamate synthase/dihydrofolate synthase [Ligilactobacillus agilis]|uniref:bifunctional folylpolyglutamate synthase/dihydrofolate synthase n=1 Tax=Ligilactobacillus agilis TaxID=1601 RepID=UPI00191F342C|nr:folylpolyglutamate synthase/dihydrofolate synthase family protein [Ligilactobacillus agilis]MBL1056493.1 bifunctional folylpolyglutamate synthase/dihydrofolate synthase [Ligilactobacillus agilis]